MVQKLKFERKNSMIIHLAEKKKEYFDSIALAKKQSAILQKSNGGLGLGSLRVL